MMALTKNPAGVVRLLLVLGAVFAARAQAGAVISEAGPVAGFGVDRGVARLMCSLPGRGQPSFARSRAVVIDTGLEQPAGEVLLVSAHGLPRDKDEITRRCVIGGVRGPAIRIDRFYLPAAPAGMTDSDWAVLVTTAPIAEPITRHRIAPLDKSAIARLRDERARLRLMLFSPEADETGCSLLGTGNSSAGAGSLLFRHSCSSWPGMSGAPLIVRIGETEAVVAINIGRIWQPAPGRKKLVTGIGLAISDEIANAVIEAVADVAPGL